MKFIKFICLHVWMIVLLTPVPTQAQISTPNDVSGLIFWADGKDVNGTGMQPANGSTITTWRRSRGLINKTK